MQKGQQRPVNLQWLSLQSFAFLFFFISVSQPELLGKKSEFLFNLFKKTKQKQPSWTANKREQTKSKIIFMNITEWGFMRVTVYVIHTISAHFQFVFISFSYWPSCALCLLLSAPWCLALSFRVPPPGEDPLTRTSSRWEIDLVVMGVGFLGDFYFALEVKRRRRN